MTNLRLLTLLLAASLLAGCNFGPDRDDDDDDATGDDDDTVGNDPVSTTISALNADEHPAGTLVTVTGVITTPFDSDVDDNEAKFWIQDGSGPGTGIQIFTFPDVVDALDEADVWAGDEVEVTGVFDAPFDFNELRVTSVNNIISNGAGSMPDAHPVAAGDIEGGFAPADLIGVLVELTDVTAESAGGHDNYWEWEADGAIIDSLFYYVDVVEGSVVDSLTGVLFMDFGNAVVAPRFHYDVDFTYEGCDTAAASGLQEINCREVDEDDDVDVEGLVVVSGSPWFSDASFYAIDPAGDLFAGVLVSSFGDNDPPEIGAIIDVVGEYEEYRGQSEIIVFDDDDIDDTGEVAVVTPIVLVDACDVTEAHEGMLVSIASVEVTRDSDGVEFGYYSIVGCTDVQIGAEFYDSREDFTDETGGEGTITDLVGVVNDELNIYAINPRSDADWASWE